MDYDCVIVGLGAMGSAAAWQAARRGWRVLGIEQFGAAHDCGSSHGQTRIIRTAYFEHPNYVPLAQRAFSLWRDIEQAVGRELLVQTGLLQIGKPDGKVIRGVLDSADAHGIEIERLAPEEIRRRWPVFRQPDKDEVGVFEPGAGFLRVEHAVASMIRLAVDAGAELSLNTTVQGWDVGDDGRVTVHSSKGTWTSRRLIVAPGCWAQRLAMLPEVPTQVVRKQQQWFQIDRHEVKSQNGFPCYLMETADGWFYGFPEIDHLGLKVAEHTGGQPVEGPERVDRGLDHDDLARAERFMDRAFEFSRRRLVHHSVCMYTMTPDHHFVVDRHPRFDNVAVACGFSGHGFKFAPVVGRRVCELLEGQEDSVCDFLRLGDRFSRDGSGAGAEDATS